jgi:chemotaxis-related protein WspD
MNLLLRKPPDDYREEWTELLSPLPHDPSNPQESFLVFKVGSELLGIKLEEIYSITTPKKIHPLPMVKNPKIAGIANLEGQLKTILSIGEILKISPHLHSKNRWILIGDSTHFFGIVADEILGIFVCDKRDIKKPPLQIHHLISCTFKMDNHNIGVLDARKLFQ